MERFYFDLIENGETFADPEGAEFTDLAAARTGAIMAIRDLLCAAVERGELPLHHVLQIRDAGHALVQRIRFDEAVSISR